MRRYLLVNFSQLIGVQRDFNCFIFTRVYCFRDKAVIVTSLADNKPKSTYTMKAWACVMDYDTTTANVFVGDYGGHVHVLKMDKETSKTSVIAVLEGHEGMMNEHDAKL